jgi:hypothetical protein
MSKNLETLKNSCDKVVDFNYMKSFTPEEISEFKNELLTVMIDVDVIETKLQEIKDEYKEKLNPLKKNVKNLLTWLRDKARTVTEECYVNYEGEYAVFYNADGEQIYKRPLEVSERQKTIFMETRNAINE